MGSTHSLTTRFTQRHRGEAPPTPKTTKEATPGPSTPSPTYTRLHNERHRQREKPFPLTGEPSQAKSSLSLLKSSSPSSCLLLSSLVLLWGGLGGKIRGYLLLSSLVRLWGRAKGVRVVVVRV